MSFAYWNPVFLKQKRLLNTQNGEYLDVEVSAPVTDTLNISGRQQNSFLFHLSAGPLQMKLWYSEDWQWLGLSSETENGRTLRYELL